MLTFKRLLVLTAIFIAASAMLMGQTTRSRTTTSAGTREREMSVEQSYLQESVELMIIREQSRAESRDMKLVALEYIDDAIQRGNTSDEIRVALEYMGLEGVVNKIRENGRLLNNYPDIRMKVAVYLGQIGTPEAKNTLKKMVVADNETMVLSEAIKSLGSIGLNDNDEVTDTISFVVSRYDVLNPDNNLANSALDAFEKIAQATGRLDPAAIRTIQRIAEGIYIKPIQNKAKQLLSDLRKYSSQKSN